MNLPRILKAHGLFSSVSSKLKIQTDFYQKYMYFYNFQHNWNIFMSYFSFCLYIKKSFSYIIALCASQNIQYAIHSNDSLFSISAFISQCFQISLKKKSFSFSLKRVCKHYLIWLVLTCSNANLALINDVVL